MNIFRTTEVRGQTSERQNFRTAVLISAALPLFLISCATTPPPDAIAPLSDAQRAQILKGMRAPEVFGLTVYDSDSGPVMAGAQRVHSGDAAILPFLSEGKSTAPIVTLSTAAGATLNTLVDTTARESWLTVPAAALLRVTPLGAPPVMRRADHVHDEYGGYLGLVQKIKLDQMHVENTLFVIRAANGPLGPLSRWEDNPPPHAVAGGNLLRACNYVQFDFVARTVAFSATTPYQPTADRLVASLPLKDVRGAMACEGSVDGKPVMIILDTGGDFDFAMKDPPESEIRQVSVGDLVFRRVQAENLYENGLGLLDNPRIGRKLLAKYKVTFDFRKKLVHFEKPVAPTP